MGTPRYRLKPTDVAGLAVRSLGEISLAPEAAAACALAALEDCRFRQRSIYHAVLVRGRKTTLWADYITEVRERIRLETKPNQRSG